MEEELFNREFNRGISRIFTAWWVMLGLIIATWVLGLAAVAAVVFAVLWGLGVWG